MSETLLELVGPDGQESFNLKINGEIKIDVKVSMLFDTLVNEANKRTANDIEVSRKTYTLSGKIAGMDDTDYPDHISTPADVNHNHAYAYNLENVADDWSVIDKNRATLKWNRGGIQQEIPGLIKELSLDIVPSKENNYDHYTYTLEFSSVQAIY